MLICMISIFVKYLKALIKIYGKWSVQASKQANIHTHVRNDVTVVWGSLRLAPIILLVQFFGNMHSLYTYNMGGRKFHILWMDSYKKKVYSPK